MSASESWILEVRRRLESPPPRPAGGDASRLVVLVPLFVAEASLWSLFTVHRPARVGAPSRLGLVGSPVQAGEQRWTLAARIAQEQLSVEAERVLRLGDLDPRSGLEGSEILPCVAAIPGPLPGQEPTVPPGLLAAPLTSLRETGRRAIVERGVEYPILRLEAPSSPTGPRLGAMELWGPPAAIIENLLLRLGLAS